MNILLAGRRLRNHAPGRALLTVCSWLYGAAVTTRTVLYMLRVLASRRLPVKTVCIGNLTVGGTGKTPAVLLAARTLHRRRLRVAILSRGYKRPKSERGVRVLLDSQETSWESSGDEPWMMHHALRGLGIPILVSADRYQAGLQALEHYDSQVLLLDDGFQHLRLERDLDILLINALDPFGGGRLLPLGDLREPLSALRRAGMIVLTHADQVHAEWLEETRGILARINPGAPILEAAHRPDFLFDLKEESKRPLSHLDGRDAACFSAIGDPASFEALVRRIGARTVQTWRYPDHHPYTMRELRSIETVRRGKHGPGTGEGTIPLVTTFKDVPRLPPGWRETIGGEVLALGIKMEILKGADLWESELSRTTSSSPSWRRPRR